MKRLRIFIGALSLVFSSASSFAAPAATNHLVGRWLHVKMVQEADGVIVRTQQSQGESTLEFRHDGTWRLASPGNKNSGTYRVVGETSIETTILQSDRQNQIGWTSTKIFKIDKNRLQLITNYDEQGMHAFAKRPDGTRPKTMRVISTFER
jgi:hypothetical protein